MSREEWIQNYLETTHPRPSRTEAEILYYEKWEKETLAYAPDYYTIENDYDDDIDVI